MRISSNRGSIVAAIVAERDYKNSSKIGSSKLYLTNSEFYLRPQ